MSKFNLTLRTCACGAEFLGKGRAKWCTDRCRKDTLYVRHCLDCGSKLSGSDGNGPNAPMRCGPCASRVSGEQRRVWTTAIIEQRIQEWHRLYGYVPSALDWNPTAVRWRIERGEAPAVAAIRAERFESADGYWPWATQVFRTFGSWNAAIAAAGFPVRPAHGGADNWKRHGVYLESAA